VTENEEYYAAKIWYHSAETAFDELPSQEQLKLINYVVPGENAASLGFDVNHFEISKTQYNNLKEDFNLESTPVIEDASDDVFIFNQSLEVLRGHMDDSFEKGQEASGGDVVIEEEGDEDITLVMTVHPKSNQVRVFKVKTLNSSGMSIGEDTGTLEKDGKKFVFARNMPFHVNLELKAFHEEQPDIYMEGGKPMFIEEFCRKYTCDPDFYNLGDEYEAFYLEHSPNVSVVTGDMIQLVRPATPVTDGESDEEE